MVTDQEQHQPELGTMLRWFQLISRCIIVVLICMQLWIALNGYQLVSSDLTVRYRPINITTASLVLVGLWTMALLVGTFNHKNFPFLFISITTPAFVLIQWVPVHTTALLLVLVVYVLASRPRKISSIVFPVMTSIGVFLVWWATQEQIPWILALTVIVAIIVVCQSIQRIIERWDRSLELFSRARWAASEYTKINQKLQDSVTHSETTARDEERTRIAREIHDILGYGITSSLVQVCVAKEQLGIDPKTAATTLTTVEESLRTALKDVREEVYKLKDPSSATDDWRRQWLSLCNNFAWSTGVKVVCGIPLEMAAVSEPMGESLYRIIQESLTNAYRHGSAHLIDIRMTYKADTRMLLLRISDNGCGADKIKPGNGLNGIRERVESLGGGIDWQTEPHAGFDLGIDIPWEYSKHE